MRTIIEKHHKDFYGWSLHCCGRNRAIAVEVLQVSYLKMLEHEETFMNRSDFKTWGFSIIRNSAIDMFRKQKKEEQLLNRDKDIPDVGYEARFDVALDKTSMDEFFSSAMNQLSTRQREILQLIFYHDLTLDQASKILGLSSGTVRKHYDRAKKTLASWFQRKGFINE